MTDITPFANRLGKNIKHLMKWAKRNNIEAWRIYDRDIPQFPFAVDVYCDQIHLQEYDTGWLMQPEEYEAWLAEVLEAVAFVTGFAPEQIHLKRRERQKGLQQYEKTAKPATISSSLKTAASFGSTSTNTSIPAFSSTTATRAKKSAKPQRANASSTCFPTQAALPSMPQPAARYPVKLLIYLTLISSGQNAISNSTASTPNNTKSSAPMCSNTCKTPQTKAKSST